MARIFTQGSGRLVRAGGMHDAASAHNAVGVAECAPAHTAKRGRAGFSLTELLMVLAILALVTTVVATCIPSAQRAYVSATDASNAQILLSTTTTRLRDVLSTVDPNKTVSENSGNAIVSFTSLDTGYKVRIKESAEGLKMEQSVGESATPVNSALLVPASSAIGPDGSMYTTFSGANSGITWDSTTGTFTVKGLQVCRTGANPAKALAKLPDGGFTVKALAGPGKSPGE